MKICSFNKIDKTGVSKALLQAMDKQNLTIRQLAEYIVVSPNTVSNWCRAKSEMTITHMVRVAEVLEISYNDLIVLQIEE